MEIKQSADLIAAIGEAFHFAMEARHEIVGVEHLFWAMLHQKECKKALKECDADIKEMIEELELFLREYVPSVPEDFDYDLEPVLSVGC
jgi:ATP-dependent Clp protease ATP-binding subunit ClpA